VPISGLLAALLAVEAFFPQFFGFFDLSGAKKNIMILL
jgi:hypothetical protein